MKRRYNGCELSSPLYRQVVAENAKKKVKIERINIRRKINRFLRFNRGRFR